MKRFHLVKGIDSSEEEPVKRPSSLRRCADAMIASAKNDIDPFGLHYESERDDDPSHLLAEVVRVGRAAAEGAPHAFCSLCALPFLTEETGKSCSAQGCERYACGRPCCALVWSATGCALCRHFVCGQHRTLGMCDKHK